MADFGDVRSLLHQSAQVETWRALCAMLSSFDEGQLRHQVLPYVEAHLRRWPDELCLAPSQWIMQLLAGEPAPQLRLARQIKTKELSAQALQRLIDCPDLIEVEAIHLQNCEISPELIEALMRAPWSRTLKTLYLAHSYLGDPQIEALSKLEGLSRLKTLDLRYNRITNEGAKTLAQCPHLGGLELLDLRYNQIEIEGALELVKENHLKHIKKIDLQSNRLDVDNLYALLERPRFRKLTSLELIGFELAPELAADLVERDLELYCAQQPSPLAWSRICKLLDRVPSRFLRHGFIQWINERLNHWPTELRQPDARWIRQILDQDTAQPKLSILRWLDLRSRFISQEVATAIADSGYLQKIEHINLEGCRMGDEAFTTLHRAGFFEGAKTLNLSSNSLRWASLEPFIEDPHTAKLRELNLNYNFIGNRGVGRIAEVPFEDLRELHLAGVGLNSLGISAIIEAQHFDRLEHLTLRENRISQEAQQRFLDAPNIPERAKRVWWA